MSLSASFPFADVADPPFDAQSAAPPRAKSGLCDFSGDGRIVDALATERSAWTCPIFYLAIPACALLTVSATVVRAWGRAFDTRRRDRS